MTTVYLEYTREMLVNKLEQIFWHIDQVERLRAPRMVISTARAPLSSGVPVSDIHSWARDFQDMELPQPIVATSTMIQLVLIGKATGSLLLDCRGMSADEVLEIWRNWPRSVISKGLNPIFIVDTPMHDTIAREGVLVEYCFESPYQSQANWAMFEAERLEFIRRKYGVDRISRGRAFLPSKVR